MPANTTTSRRSTEAHTCPRCGMWRSAEEYSAPHAITSCRQCEAALSSSSLRPCRSCRTWYPGNEYPVNGTSTRCRQCSSRNRSQRRTRRSESTTSPRPSWTTRKFGVELEFVGSRPAVVNELRARGLAAESQGYNHRRSSGWKVVPDGSVMGGGELVSPVLEGAAGLEQLKQACEALTAAGATIKQTCGLHVHLDARGEGLDSIKGFVTAYVQRQLLIDALVAPSRRRGRNMYCRTWSDDDVRTLQGMWRTTQLSGINRYKTVNVASYGRHGTIEVRQHQGTTSAAKVTAWVELLMRLWDATKRGEQLSLTSTRQLLVDLGMDSEQVEWWMRRATALACWFS